MLNSHTTVASIGKPMAILNFSIHAPGFGRNFNHAGFQLNTTYGAASPMPTARKINTMNAALWANAKPSAMLKNGAVQGVARIVASTPLKNAPAAPCFEARFPAASSARPPSVTSNTPNKFKRDQRDERGEADEKNGIAELHAPAGLMPGGLDADDDGREREKRNQHANRINQTHRPDAARFDFWPR